ncbi:MAG: spore cortex biosynthesis protein YabQ [Coprococcus sp.]
MTDMIRQQLLTYGISVLCGIGAGLLLGVVRELRKAIGTKNVLLAIWDILFWLMLSGLIVGVNYIYSGGEIRLYVFLGIFSGILLYFCTINWVVSRIVGYILYLIKNALKNVKKASKKLVDIICRKG